MSTLAESKTDTHLSNFKKTESRAQEEFDEAREEKVAQQARLRALRLAKEATDGKP